LHLALVSGIAEQTLLLKWKIYFNILKGIIIQRQKRTEVVWLKHGFQAKVLCISFHSRCKQLQALEQIIFVAEMRIEEGRCWMKAVFSQPGAYAARHSVCGHYV
jgi:hypothetical protein